jgi:hypothetical protein
MYNHLVGFVVASILTVLLSAIATPASAAVIDFRTSPWGPGGPVSETNGNTTVSAEPGGATLTHNSNGFGADFGVIDRDSEIDIWEQLRVKFLVPMMVEAVLVTELYHELFLGQWINETGYLMINNSGNWVSFQALDSNASSGDGALWVNIVPQSVNEIVFAISAPPNLSSFLNFKDDFRLGAIRTVDTIAAVPEPGSMILLGTGLCALATRARKRWYPVKPQDTAVQG